ncbi:MAG: RsmB/NOP family class I SAM-dependent RNA methyltransferase [Candidatus Kryptoniota bacterium]
MNSSSLAGHAIELLNKIVGTNLDRERNSLPADKIIADFYKQRRYFGSHDRRWVTEKVYSIIRNFIFIKELSKLCLSNRDALGTFLIHEIKFAGMKEDKLRSDYSQLLETYRLSGREIDLENLVARVNDAAIKLASDPANYSLVNSFPDFFCELLPPNIKRNCISIMTALNRKARVCVRVDTTKISRERAMAYFGDHGIETSFSEFSPFGIYLSKRINLNSIGLYKEGSIEVQEEASQLVGLIVDPQEGETIVDACAGAGGKSLELATLSEGKSKIFALDVDEERLNSLRARAERSGYKNIAATKVSNDDFTGVEMLIGVADKVIVDAPCTGSGTIRRNPDKKFRLTKLSVEKQAVYQKRLLEDYSQLVKVGGLLFYVTCSIFEEENQAVVNYFLDSIQNFRKVDVSTMLVDPKFENMMGDGFLAIYPHRYEMDGFFVAVMERVS